MINNANKVVQIDLSRQFLLKCAHDCRKLIYNGTIYENQIFLIKEQYTMKLSMILYLLTAFSLNALCDAFIGHYSTYPYLDKAEKECGNENMDIVKCTNSIIEYIQSVEKLQYEARIL